MCLLLRRYSRARGSAVRKKEPLLIEQPRAILMAMPADRSRMTRECGATKLFGPWLPTR